MVKCESIPATDSLADLDPEHLILIKVPTGIAYNEVIWSASKIWTVNDYLVNNLEHITTEHEKVIVVLNKIMKKL
jgi:hypothetical protein